MAKGPEIPIRYKVTRFLRRLAFTSALPCNKGTQPLAKPELGTKRTCPECAARFYDLGKMPCECPKCEHAFEPEILLKSKKRIEEDKPPVKEREKTEAEAEEEEETEVEEVTAEGMNKMPEEVDEDGVAITPDEEESDVEIEGVDLSEDESEDNDNDTLMEFDDSEDDVAGIMTRTIWTSLKTRPRRNLRVFVFA